VEGRMGIREGNRECRLSVSRSSAHGGYPSLCAAVCRLLLPLAAPKGQEKGNENFCHNLTEIAAASTGPFISRQP